MNAALAMIVGCWMIAPVGDRDDLARSAFLGLPGFGAAQEPAGPKPSPSGRRVPRKIEDFQALMDTNLFSPPRPKPSPGEAVRGDDRGPAAKAARKLTITGFVYNGAEGRFEVLVEDRKANGKSGSAEVRFCKPGETIGACSILEITSESMKVRSGEEERVLKVGDEIDVEGQEATSAGEAKPPAEGASKDAPRASERRREVEPDEVEEEIDVPRRRRPRRSRDPRPAPEQSEPQSP